MRAVQAPPSPSSAGHRQALPAAEKLTSRGSAHINVDAYGANGFDQHARPTPMANPTAFGPYPAVGPDPAAYRDGRTPVHGGSAPGIDKTTV